MTPRAMATVTSLEAAMTAGACVTSTGGGGLVGVTAGTTGGNLTVTNSDFSRGGRPLSDTTTSSGYSLCVSSAASVAEIRRFPDWSMEKRLQQGN